LATNSAEATVLNGEELIVKRKEVGHLLTPHYEHLTVTDGKARVVDQAKSQKTCP